MQRPPALYASAPKKFTFPALQPHSSQRTPHPTIPRVPKTLPYARLCMVIPLRKMRPRIPPRGSSHSMSMGFAQPTLRDFAAFRARLIGSSRSPHVPSRQTPSQTLFPPLTLEARRRRDRRFSNSRFSTILLLGLVVLLTFTSITGTIAPMAYRANPPLKNIFQCTCGGYPQPQTCNLILMRYSLPAQRYSDSHSYVISHQTLDNSKFFNCLV